MVWVPLGVYRESSVEDLGYKNEQEWKNHYSAVRKRIEDAALTAAAQAKAAQLIRDERAEAIEAERAAKELEALIEYAKHTTPCQRLLTEVAREHQLTPGEIRGKSRSKGRVLARQEFCYRARAELKWSLNKIGMFLGRDHTTVLHGIRKHAQRNGLGVPKVE